MSTTSTPGCDSFRPLPVRPDKCRNCFGAKSKHLFKGQQDEIKSDGSDHLDGELCKKGPSNTATGDKGDVSQAKELGLQIGEAESPDKEPLQTSATNKCDSPTEKKECEACSIKDKEINRLKCELDEWRQRCLKSEQDHSKTRAELQSLEHEMEEMHDNFKEEENEQFEQLKQELDAAVKNCKILQIRLNKSERQYGQLEQIKSLLEKQLNERQNESSSNHRSVQSGQISDHQQAFAQLGTEFVRLSTREYDQLLRDLNDISEREHDLQEQIRYSQEEAQMKSDRLQAIEAENEVLICRINRLTLANSRLRSSIISSNSGELGNETGKERQQLQRGQDENSTSRDERAELRKMIEQNEQLELGLELAQSECSRLRARLQETRRAPEESKQEGGAKTINDQVGKATEVGGSSQESTDADGASSRHKLELECRQLRARLVHSERQCRQLKSQLELLASGGTTPNSGSARRPSSQTMQQPARSLQPIEADPSGVLCSSIKCRDRLRRSEEQCRELKIRNDQLSKRVERQLGISTSPTGPDSLAGNAGDSVGNNCLGSSATSSSNMEVDLIDKLKRQLEISENELAKARSRMVELDLDCGRAQRQYRRLMNSLETCGSGETQVARKNKLPPESVRDTMSRQSLRQTVCDLESDMDEMLTIIKAKDCLLKEQQEMLMVYRSGQPEVGAACPHQDSTGSSGDGSGGGGGCEPSQLEHADTSSARTSDEQVKSLRRLLDQERLSSSNLKLDVANLDRDKLELQTRASRLERERESMEEELDKLRQFNGELRAELDESQREKRAAQSRAKDLNDQLEKIRDELVQARSGQLPGAQQHPTTGNGSAGGTKGDREPPSSGPSDLMLMARDLSELKVKNGFLMRQLELARESTARQLEEQRESLEAQHKRASEMAQIELKESHLGEMQQVRDELNDLKQKLAAAQRQLVRQEEETNSERDRVRALERDWRRDKSQWQQQREHLEGQLALERRSGEFRLKEAEAAIRDKERALISVQDRCVQLGRDLKRLQNKYQLLEEEDKSRIKTLTRELETKSKELSDLMGEQKLRDMEHLEAKRQLNDDRAALSEALSSIRKSYDERSAELRQTREMLRQREEQAYKERVNLVERIKYLSTQLNELGERETHNKLLRQRVEVQERQLESARRDLLQVREERSRLKSRCDELEKRELIARTTTISGSSPSALLKSSSTSGGARDRSVLGARRADKARQAESAHLTDSQQAGENNQADKSQTIERLSGKINDQRHLIQMVSQQLSETQLELKQTKLLQASERTKWQARVAILTGRLNECEEKLAFETAMLAQHGHLLHGLARPRFEANWASERQSSLELIQQQQAQIEMLTRDLKKVGQAHDLLRLHSKQLESQNNKLSKKLIEYQQQSAQIPVQRTLTGGGGGGGGGPDVDELEARHAQLVRIHAKIAQETRPLVSIVAKIVASLEAPDASASSSNSYDSTNRPLRTFVSGQASDDSNEAATADAGQPHQQQQQKSRLARLLTGSRQSSPASKKAADFEQQPDQQQQRKKPKRVVKRVRVKCSSLGITTDEKRQMKQHLKALSEALANVDCRSPVSSQGSSGPTHIAQQRPDSIGGQASVGSARTPTPRGRPVSSGRSRTGSQLPALVSELGDQRADSVRFGGEQKQSQSPSSGRVHWQLDSDLDSDRSLSMEPAGREVPPSSAHLPQNSGAYRRFPQATPASYGASFTDYDSESSLASNYSFTPTTSSFRHQHKLHSQTGAESDSGLVASAVGSSGRLKLTTKRRPGLRSRLTNTLRNISRSITGLASDSESSELAAKGAEGREETKGGRQLREIRV